MRYYNSEGMKVSKCLEIVGLTKNQYYYPQTGQKPGRRPSKTTEYKDHKTGEVIHICNTEVVERIVKLKLNPDHANHYRLLTKTLCLQGFYINHKKVYRLMYEHLILEDRQKRVKKKYVDYWRAVPTQPLEILEMDIKYVWVHEKRRYAFILTVIDTFTRYVLHWDVGFSMKTLQVKQVWEYLIAQYIQPIRGKRAEVEIEVRSDNGKQFSSKEILKFFEENELTKVFTHPYTPEENGHIESFHKTLGKALKKEKYASLTDLEQRLKSFYTTYNNYRSHGSIKGLPPAIFWSLYEMNEVDLMIDQEKRKITIELKVAYQDILGLPNINKHKYRALQS